MIKNHNNHYKFIRFGEKTMLQILLVDDHSVVRAGVRQILQEADFSIDISEAADAASALKKIRQQRWDLVLLDIRLPDRSGVELLKLIKADNPKLPVLILSTYPESQYAVRLIHGGASGYLSKDADDEEILKAVKTAAKGKRYLTLEVAELLANHITRGVQDDKMDCMHETLSDREYQVFLELAIGSGPNIISDKLNVSAKTITTHRARILQKMGFTNNAEIVLYANRHDLIN